MPLNSKSSVKAARPLASLSASIFLTARPTYFSSSLICAVAPVLFSSPQDRFDRLDVARAAAEDAIEGLAHLCLRGARPLVEQRLRHQNHRRRAVATLYRARPRERPLQSRGPRRVVHPFKRDDTLPVGLCGEHDATDDGASVDEHGARPAIARLAAVLDACEALAPQEPEEKESVVDFQGLLHAVDLDANLHRHSPSRLGAVRGTSS